MQCLRNFPTNIKIHAQDSKLRGLRITYKKLLASENLGEKDLHNEN